MVYLASGVSDRLAAYATGDQQVAAWLVGITDAEQISVLDVIAKQGADLQEDLEYVRRLVPVGLNVLGTCVSSTAEAVTATTAESAATAQQRLSKATSMQLPLVAVTASSTTSFFLISGSGMEATQSKDLARTGAAWLSEHYGLLRCSIAVSLQVVGTSSNGDDYIVQSAGTSSAIADAFNTVCAELCSESTTFVADAAGQHGRVMLGGGSEETTCSSGDGSQPTQIVPFLRRQSHSTAAPILTYQPHKGGPIGFISTLLALDVLWYVRKSQRIAVLDSQPLRQGLSWQLDWMQEEMQRTGSVAPCSAFHFRPAADGLTYTIVYPLSTAASPQALDKSEVPQEVAAAEEKLTDLRRRLHERLIIPTNRPLLRMANSLQFGGADGNSSRTSILQDVHVGLGPSGVMGGQRHMIWGSYSYHHYMQGKMDDSGWGCAYRSLQTICSWFRLQNFTSHAIPTHREIQQILVDIGDKQRSFVGSKQWIGAIELGYILDSLLGVTSKIITVSAGADIDQKGREIAHHFDTQGTPIMVGGGVLAYTLLGIDFNAATGECAFLILDPHYTGADDLKRIQSGQWVAWKRADGRAAAGGDLFVKDAFYNLLCPQLPDMI